MSFIMSLINIEAQTNYDSLKIEHGLYYRIADNEAFSGEYISFYENGNIKFSGFMLDGIKDSIFRWYRLDGSIMYSTKYESGNMHVKCTQYHPNGKISRIINYKNGNTNGICYEYNEKGFLSEKYFFNISRAENSPCPVLLLSE